MPVIPTDPAAITVAWLSEVLQLPVTHCQLDDSHSGTTGRAVLRLRYQTSGAYPDRVFVKLPPSDDQQKGFVKATGMGRREVLFYQHLANEIPVRVPRCYYAASDAAGDNYIMLLEHLEDSGCSFQPLSRCYSLEYLRSVLTSFARLHAQYWQSPRFEAGLAWVEPPLQFDLTLSLIERALQQHSHQMPPVFTAMGELYLARADRIHSLWREGSHTLIHGDVHDGNMFMEGGQPGFLDWALLAKGPGMRDVGYFLAGALTADDQQQHSTQLLRYYRDQLQNFGVQAPSMDELQRQYQWHAAYVWVGAAATLAMGDAWQSVSYVSATLKRLHATLDGLGSVAALRAQM